MSCSQVREDALCVWAFALLGDEERGGKRATNSSRNSSYDWKSGWVGKLVKPMSARPERKAASTSV